MTLALLLIPFMAILHRLRGGGFVTMPVKGTYVLWPLVGLAAWGVGAPWPVALAWAIGYLVWIIPGWMSHVTAALGIQVPQDQEMGAGSDVSLIGLMSFGHPVLACFLRAFVYIVPLAIALANLHVNPAWLLLIVVGFYPAYWIGYRVSRTNLSGPAELIVGALWGIAMWGTML